MQYPLQVGRKQRKKELKYRDLTGPEKIRLFTKINIPSLFPTLPKREQLQNLWCTFFKLINKINEQNCDSVEIDIGTKSWVTSFISVYQSKDCTPYVHAFTMHTSEFIRLHGNIVSFTQQGLEKLNDVTTKQYQRATNHHNLSALKQILEKRNRIEILKDSGYEREQVDVLPSKNQALCCKLNLLIYCHSMYCNDVT